MACLATASATTRLTLRQSAMGGSSGASGSASVGERPASALAEAMIMASETRVDRETRIPSARPGKMNELLTCEMRTGLPLTSTGRKGLPVPTSTRPSVQRSRSAGVASAFEVGFESGKITGRARMAGHLADNLFGKCAGLGRDAHQHGDSGVAHNIEQRDGARPGPSGQLPSLDVGSLAHQRLLAGADALASLDQESVAIEAVDALASLLFAQSLFFHRGNQQIADADARRAGAEHGNGLLFERKPGGADGGQQRAGGDGGGSLNVVVEGAEPVAIAPEQDGRVDAGEVLPLQENVRPAALDGGRQTPR